MQLIALALVLAAAPVPPVAGPVWTSVAGDLGFVGFDGDYPFAETTIELPNVRIRLLISSGKLPIGREAVRAWVETNARAVARYYGTFPGEEVTVTVLTGGRGEVDGGTTFGGRAIRINVGLDATKTTLEKDWRMTHELLHVAFADLDERYHYLEEGLSTYLEPVIRAQAGLISDERVWGDLVDGLPKGMPGTFDHGMDSNQSWGTLYWGGARFWLMAELGIRQKTGGKKTLQDALKAIYFKGGNGRVHLDLEKVIALGDAATGTSVLKDLHTQMGKKKDSPDFDALFKQLGVEQHGDLVTFHDDAPLAATRIAITHVR